MRRCRELTEKFLELDKNSFVEIICSLLRIGFTTPHNQVNWFRFKNPVSRRTRERY